MMKNILVLTLVIFCSNTSFSQKGVIKGELVDFKTGKPIADAPIILYGTTNGVTSNSEGKFELNKLKFNNTELIVHGQSVTSFDTGEETAKNNNYYTMILRNINLSKENQTVDLGEMSMVYAMSEKLFEELPCKELNGVLYKYLIVDGKERYINGKMGLLDLGNPTENCTD